MRLFAALEHAARCRPDKIALITEKSQLTLPDVMALAAACAAGLGAGRLGPGQRLVLTTDRPELVLAFVALASRQALTLILAPARVVLAAGVGFDTLVGLEPADGVDPARQVIIEPGWFGQSPAAPFALPGNPAGDGQVVFATSGSTGMPKLVAYGEALLECNYAGPEFFRALPADATSRLLMSATLATAWGLLGGLRALVAGGSLVALDEHRNRPLQYIDLYRVSHFETTPMVIRQMLDLPDAAQFLASLHSIVVGGAFASTELLTRLAALTAAPIDVAYGTSEFGALALARFDPERPRGDGHLGAVFRTDIEISFFDAALRPLPGASEGIVGFRRRDGAEVPVAYLGAEASADATLSGFQGGYFFPGDVMRLVGDQLYLIGRVKNVINVGGNKIALEAVQAALEAALDVRAIACLAQTDAYGLEQLAVAYVAPATIAASALQAVLDERFPGLRLCRAQRLEALPQTTGGKIDTEALRRSLA